MYKIQLKGQSGESHWVAEKNVMLGSAADCTLVAEGAEAHHARLITQNGHLILRDNRSQTGSYVNGQRVTERELFPSDTIRLGTAELIVLGPDDALSESDNSHLAKRWCLVSDSSWLAGQEFVIAPGMSAIGRGAQCGIVIPGTHLSRQHAEFELLDNQLKIRDLGSANGSFVNDHRIAAHQQVRLVPGDRLRFDVYSFRVIGPGMTTGSTRLRQSLSDSAIKERKAINTDPKHWKTKPTSPGNREEPRPVSHGHRIALAIIAGLLVAAGGYLSAILKWW
ncbi:FHA domain-containing protein [Simiduia aestuariiviva]|uniref:PSer/pThr/pTyr-binding forkhead associated (FHA) protein n=1 Tax=Simiduia aestuariiviva TaxID=1510459 RepID=A0A839UTJ4_9GAMM|nr:FHA domain-containing protein [Simiduia aestuariiviva]MBB3169286.1 pSer/pThr/pTyr-binding forkhead associated (FHA) protein [Simiduia aestuariiviva]